MVYKSPFFTTILGEYIFSTFPSIEQANPSQNHGLSSPKGEQRWNAGTSYHLGFDGFWPTTVADRWSKASILLHPNNGGGWFRWVFLQTTWMILRWTRRYIFRGVYVSSFEEWTLLMELPKSSLWRFRGSGKVYTYTLNTGKKGETNLTLPNLHSHVGQAALWDTWQLKHWVCQDGCLKHQKTTTKKHQLSNETNPACLGI